MSTMIDDGDDARHHQAERRRRRTRRVYTLAGSPVACRAYSRISRPTPPRSPVEISATTTPTTDAGAGQLERRHHVRHGGREAQLAQRLRPRRRRSCRISSSDVAGADSRPRSVPTATGKKARNAPSTTTDSHRGHSHPNGWSLPPQLTTSGASAISGTVCDDHEVRQQAALDDAEAGHHHRQARRRRRAERRTRRGRARNEYHAPRATTAKIVRARRAALGVEQPLAPSSHDVRHRRVVGARAGAPAEHLAAVLRADAPCRPPTTAATRTRASDEQDDLAHDARVVRSRASGPASSRLGQHCARSIAGMTCSP